MAGALASHFKSPNPERICVFGAYAGAGLGGVYSALWHDLDGEDSFTFGYQGILGVKYTVNDNFEVGLSYKLLGTFERDPGPTTAKGALSHSIMAAFTFRF